MSDEIERAEQLLEALRLWWNAGAHSSLVDDVDRWIAGRFESRIRDALYAMKAKQKSEKINKEGEWDGI